MIHALLQYARDRGLVSKPGYTKKTVKWILDFDETGSRFGGMVTSDREFENVPDLSQPELIALGAKMGQGAHFLVAPLGTFLAWGKDEKAEEKERKRRETLIWMLKEAGKTDSGLETLSRTLLDAQIEQKMHAETQGHKPAPKPTDLATVCLGGRFPVEESTWHAWWDEFRGTLKKKADDQPLRVCFGTGELVEPAPTHPKLKKLSGVGLSQPHAPMITFDKDAFESYGLKQAENAAMNEETANIYVNAIDRLLEESVIYSWRRPRGAKDKDGKKLSVEFAKLGGARLIYWYTGPEEARKVVEEDLNKLRILFGSADKDEAPHEDPEEERILAESRLRKMIERIRSGETAQPVRDVRFCVIALSGAGGRVMVRDFIEGSILQLADSTEKWFENLSLDTYWGRSGFPPGLEQVLTSPLAAKKLTQDYLDWVRPAGTWRQALWRAALTGSNLPQTAFARALLAHNNTVVRGDLTDEREGRRAQRISRLRLALVKAYLIRKGIDMQPALDPEHPSAAYHCGRLLAVYDSLQRRALGDVGAGVIQRYYGGALANPSGVFAQLSRLAQSHLHKESVPTNFYKNRIAEIHNGIRREGDSPAEYPSALDLEDQALFALGFWHQIAATNKELADISAAKNADKEKSKSSKNNQEDNIS